jgi:hypothetical protein
MEVKLSSSSLNYLIEVDKSFEAGVSHFIFNLTELAFIRLESLLNLDTSLITLDLIFTLKDSRSVSFSNEFLV